MKNNLTKKELNYLLPICDSIAISAVKKAAAGSCIPYISKKDGERHYKEIPPLDSAMAIVNSGYTDTIMDDLKQEVRAAVLTLIDSGDCTIVPDIKQPYSLMFSDMNTLADTSDIFIKQVYSMVRKYLQSQKQIKGNKWLCVPLAVEDEESDEYNEILVSIKDAEYKQALLHDMDGDTDRIRLQEIKQAFKDHLKSRDYEVFCALMLGTSYQAIGDKLGLTKRAVQCTVERIRKQFLIVDGAIYKVDKHGTKTLIA